MARPTRPWPLIVALAPLLLAPLAADDAPGTRKPPPSQVVTPDDGWVDDRGLQQGFERGATMLIDAGRAPAMDVVRQGLETRSCRLDLLADARDAGDMAVSSETLYDRARRGVAVVGSAHQCGRCNNWHVGGATGFFLTSGGALVTNHHVVDQADKRAALFAMTSDGRVFPITATLAADAQTDVAIVQVDPTDQHGNRADFAPLPLAEASRTGQNVRVVSHPDGRHYALTEGIVSRRYADAGRGGSRWMTITADYARGSSGGPLFDDAGRVVGIVSSTAGVYYDHGEDKQPRNLQMVWKQCVPVENIRALLAAEAAE